jgi:hypothetical protein
MGRPEDLDHYLAIQVGEWARRYGTVYVPWEMWKSLRPNSREFTFYIQDGGRVSLEFDVPIGRIIDAT